MDLNEIIETAVNDILNRKPAPPSLDIIFNHVKDKLICDFNYADDLLLETIIGQAKTALVAGIKLEGLLTHEQLKKEINAHLVPVRKALEDLANKPDVSITPAPTVLEVRTPDTVTKLEEHMHPKLKDLVKSLAIGLPTCLIGPTGSGKTLAARQAARALSIRPENILVKQVNRLTSPADFLGFINAGGTYSSRKFVELLKSGEPCLVCIDEMDNGNENVLMLLKGLFSGYIETPDGVVEVSPSVRVMATMNTYGLGATREYVGRGPQDQALLNEFTKLDWPYDEGFEQQLATNEFIMWKTEDCAFNTTDIKNMVGALQKSREVIIKEGFRAIVSTRNIIHVIRNVVTNTQSLLTALEYTCLSHLKSEELTRLKQHINLIINPQEMPKPVKRSAKDPWKAVYGTEDAPF